MAPQMKKQDEFAADSSGSGLVSSFASSSDRAPNVSLQLQSYLEKSISGDKTPFLALNGPERAHAAILDGNNFPRIQKGDMLSEGEFSQTFYVTKIAGHTTSENYSIKCLHPKVDEQPSVEAFESAVSRLLLEALYLASLEHDFLLKLHGFSLGEHIDTVFLLTNGISETLENRMHNWIRRRREREASKTKRSLLLESLEMDLAISSDQAEEEPPDDLVALQTNYALQIAQALEYLHERGLVVRDLQPSNIGFKDYPEHHTIQLFELGSCHEIPVDGGWIPPEDIKPADTPGRICYSRATSMAGSCDSSSSTDGDFMDNSRHTASNSTRSKSSLAGSMHGGSRHTNSNSIRSRGMRLFRSNHGSEHSLRLNTSRHGKPKELKEDMLPRPSPKHYRAPESYTEVDPSSLEESTVLPAPDASSKKHAYEGYNTKADLFSWSMIYYEMLAEGRPYSQRVLMKEGHYYRVQTLGQRPILYKHHFPRTIKAVLAQAWDPVLSKRATAKHLCKQLNVILNMLEGQGLPWSRTNSSAATSTSVSEMGAGNGNGCDSVPEMIGLSLDSTSTTLPSQQQSVQLTLPERAVALMLHHPSSTKGWSNIWNETQKTQKLDPQKVVEALTSRNKKDAKKEKNEERGEKPKTLKKIVLKKVASLRRMIPFDPKAGMVRNERNDAAARRLLGADYEKYMK